MLPLIKLDFSSVAMKVHLITPNSSYGSTNWGRICSESQHSINFTRNLEGYPLYRDFQRTWSELGRRWGIKAGMTHQ